MGPTAKTSLRLLTCDGAKTRTLPAPLPGGAGIERSELTWFIQSLFFLPYAHNYIEWDEQASECRSLYPCDSVIPPNAETRPMGIGLAHRAAENQWETV